MLTSDRPPVVFCDFGENRGKPHQPFNPVPPLYNPTVCNYCGRKLVLMGSVWAVDLTPEYLGQRYQSLIDALIDLERDIRHPLPIWTQGQERLTFVAERLATIIEAHRT